MATHASDVGRLWQIAVNRYIDEIQNISNEESKGPLTNFFSRLRNHENSENPKKKVPHTLHPDDFPTPEKISDFLKDGKKQFDSYRHEGGTKERIRSSLSACAGAIDKVGNLAAALASSAFAPAPVIMSAMTLLLRGTQDVSEDYDVVVSFFDNSTDLLTRVSLLENKMPKEGKFDERVVDVFRSILELCAISQRFIQKRRWKAWAQAVLNGEHSGLKNAHESFERSVRKLESDIAVHTLTTAIETKKTVHEMSAKMSTHHSDWIETRALFREARDDSRQVRKMLEQFCKNGPESVRKVKYDPGARRSIALDILRRELSAGDEALYHVDRRLSGMPASNNIDYEKALEWLRSDISKFESEKEKSILRLQGKLVTGNPRASFFVYNYLHECFSGNSSISVAYFFFDHQLSKLQSMEAMLSCCAIQLARQDQDYQRKLLRSINNALPEKGAERYWDYLFQDFFGMPSGGEAKKTHFIILDGIGEVPVDHAKGLSYVLEKSKTSLLGFVVLGDQDANESGTAGPPTDCVDEDMATADKDKTTDQSRMEAYIEAGIKSSPVLSNFEKNLQEKIVKKLKENADGSCYVDYFLRRFENSRKSVVWRELHAEFHQDADGVVDSLLGDLEPYQREVALYLLLWLAYVPGELTVGSATSLLKAVRSTKSGVEHQAQTERSRNDDRKGSSKRTASSKRSNSNQSRKQSRENIKKQGDNEPKKQRGEKSESLELEAFNRTISEIRRQASQLLNGIVRIREYDDVDFQSVQQTFNYSPERSRSIVEFQEKFFSAPFRRPKGPKPPVTDLVRMIEMTGSILTRASRNEEGLLAYSGRSWFQYFIKLNIILKTETGNIKSSDIKESEVRTVTKHLREIMTNQGDALRRVESTVDADADDLYCSIFCTKQADLKEGLEMLQKWLEFVEGLGKASKEHKDKDLLQWVLNLTKAKGTEEFMYEVLKGIAKLHVKNWLSSTNTTDAWISFRFAHDTLNSFPEDKRPEFLKSSNERAEKKPLPIEVFGWIADQDESKSLDKDPRRQKCIAKALRYDGQYGEASDQLAKVSDKRFETLELIARYEFAKIEDSILAEEMHSPLKEIDEKDLKEALKKYDTALAQKITSSKEALQNKPYQRKAWIQMLLGKTTDALETVKEVPARDENPIYYFAEMVEAMGENEQWKGIITLLESLEKYPNTLECSSKSLDFIRRAAATKESEKVIDRWYEGEVKKSKQAYTTHLLLRSFAKFKRVILGDSKGAIETLEKVLDSHKIGLQDIIPTTWDLGDALLDQFLVGQTIAQKRDALSKMEEVVELVKHRMVVDFQPEFSQTSIPLAFMKRRLGPPESFEEHINATFKACRAALEDDIWENDSESFRILAKALSLLPGLEDEAMVACSLQFYDMQATQTRQTKSAKSFDWKVTCASCDCSISKEKIKDSKGPVVYLCYYCIGVDLCQECYDRKRQEEQKEDGKDNAAKERRLREICPLNNHQYIQAPINGWEVVSDNPFKFKFKVRGTCLEYTLEAWLKTLDRAWELAWKRYWSQH